MAQSLTAKPGVATAQIKDPQTLHRSHQFRKDGTLQGVIGIIRWRRWA
ncbi:MAG: hypothetical protein R3E79_06590 [Caldilineaceae bacterium]